MAISVPARAARGVDLEAIVQPEIRRNVKIHFNSGFVSRWSDRYADVFSIVCSEPLMGSVIRSPRQS